MCDKVSLDPKLSLSKVLAITSGFTGADLVNEADIVAHHEMGLVLMALALPNGDTMHKVFIVARCIGSLGYTIQRPTEGPYQMTQAELKRKICVLLGGHAAEKIMLGHSSTDGADDLVKATQIAHEMPMRYA